MNREVAVWTAAVQFLMFIGFAVLVVRSPDFTARFTRAFFEMTPADRRRWDRALVAAAVVVATAIVALLS